METNVHIKRFMKIEYHEHKCTVYNLFTNNIVHFSKLMKTSYFILAILS